MRKRKRLFGYSLGLALTVGGGSAWAAEPTVYYPGGQPNCAPLPNCPRPETIPVIPAPATKPSEKPEPGKPPADQPQDQAQPQTDAFNQTPESGTETAQSFNPQMIGDFIGYTACRKITSSSSSTSSSGGSFSGSSSSSIICGVVGSRNGFKIADNESPRPMCRIFGTYNYYNNLEPDTGSGFTRSGTPLATGGGDLHRELFGFEYAFLDQNASIGIRAPVFQQTGGGSFGDSDFGDLSVILKYAFYNDPFTGNLLSAGLVVTTPTGPNINTIAGNIHSTLLQPYVGYIINRGPFYVHGFSSLVAPTENEDVTLMFNDIGLGYFLRPYAPNQLISFIAPTFECHVTTPLDHRGEFEAIIVPDIVALTGGVHFGVGAGGIFTVGAAVPVTGPQPYDYQVFTQLNFRF